MRPYLWFLCAFLVATGAAAQSASRLFGAEEQPLPADDPAALGSYARGCLAGGAPLPETAPGWQAMRLSRNRNWGHPEMIAFIERLSARAREVGWPGLYIGDIGQPRGGPMQGGHRSHQIGLDVDIWLRRPDSGDLSVAERERIGSVNVVAGNGVDLNGNWTRQHHLIIQAAAEDAAVARIFVNPAIKRGMCDAERGPGGEVDAPWLRKVRPWQGHDHHFHVRLHCPPGDVVCREQAPPPPGDGCGAELAKWFPRGTRSVSAWAVRDDEEAMEAEKRTRGLSGELTLSDLPPACRAVVNDNAAALASLAPVAGQAATPIVAPVFPNKEAEAHTGFLGTRYFWSPPTNRAAAEQLRVSLAVEGELPPGLDFVDRGGGHGLLSGIPEAEGSWTFDVIARDRRSEQGRLSVTVPIEQLRAETAEAARLPSLEFRIRDFIADFTGSECFLAVPVEVSEAKITVESFADDSAPFYDFDAAFRAAMGAEAMIGGRLVSSAQCEALAFARAFPNDAPPQITLSDPDRVLGPGQRLEATISGDSVRYVTPLLIRPDGSVIDLSQHMTREGPALKIAAEVPGTGPHLLLAVDTAAPLVHADPARPGAGDMLASLRAENAAQHSDMKVSLGYFVLE
ncbi:MAG TPA: penicillin-insensitive murein endopeptidase [Paracoccaceae bacterium]|nr:penicillin-insensitive murein endopeptidase [Paracoccaceae bacterium]